METPAAASQPAGVGRVGRARGYGVPVPSSNSRLNVENVELATLYTTYRRGVLVSTIDG